MRHATLWTTLLAASMALGGCGLTPTGSITGGRDAAATAQGRVSTPDWVKNATFYQIFPERFYNGNRANDPKDVQAWGATPTYYNFMGGDLEGVTQKLPYLQELGVTAIYLNPIFTSNSNHKYNTADFMHVDPHFGGDAAFRTMLKAAHARGMKVILDGVFNHISDDHPFFLDAKTKGPQSKYWNWFTFYGFPVVTEPKPNYNCWWGFGTLPQWKAGSMAEVQNYIYEVEEHWLKEGIDGWRLDVPNEIDNDAFWRGFRTRAKAINPEAYIVGEIWTEADRWLQGDQFDAVMNYPLRNAMMGFFNGGYSGSHGTVPGLNADGFENWINGLRNKYQPAISDVQFNLISSHDVERFSSIVGGNMDKLRLATTFQLTYPGAPVIYYGDEIGMTGAKDPDNRRCFEWSTSKQNAPVLQHYKTLIALRNRHPELRTGAFRGLRRHNDWGLYAYVRELGQQKAVVMLNNGAARDYGLDVSSAFGEGTRLVDGLTHTAYTVTQGQVALKMKANQGFVLVPAAAK